MHDYFYKIFPSQLGLLAFHRTNQIVRTHMRDDAIVFFGGKDWDNVTDDLSRIPSQERVRFILSLFMVVLTDQCLYTYQPDSYPLWRQQTNFPKFGWSGFGPHNENPFKVLWAPEREKAAELGVVAELMPEFVTFMLEETNRFFTNTLPNLRSEDYFALIRQDGAYAFNKGQIVHDFKKEFEAQTTCD